MVSQIMGSEFVNACLSLKLIVWAVILDNDALFNLFLLLYTISSASTVGSHEGVNQNLILFIRENVKLRIMVYM